MAFDKLLDLEMIEELEPLWAEEEDEDPVEVIRWVVGRAGYEVAREELGEGIHCLVLR